MERCGPASRDGDLALPWPVEFPDGTFFTEHGLQVARAYTCLIYQVRLFRLQGLARYNNVAVHENLTVDGEIGTLVGHLDHYTERSIRDHFKKFGLYTSLAAQEKAKTVRTVGWIDLVFRPSGGLGQKPIY